MTNPADSGGVKFPTKPKYTEYFLDTVQNVLNYFVLLKIYN